MSSELVDRCFEITLRDGNRAAQRLQQWVPIVDPEGLARQKIRRARCCQ